MSEQAGPVSPLVEPGITEIRPRWAGGRRRRRPPGRGAWRWVVGRPVGPSKNERQGIKRKWPKYVYVWSGRAPFANRSNGKKNPSDRDPDDEARVAAAVAL